MTKNKGHITRLSLDSSLYDEICVLCGASDAIGDNGLILPCPIVGDARKARINVINDWRKKNGRDLLVDGDE